MMFWIAMAFAEPDWERCYPRNVQQEAYCTTFKVPLDSLHALEIDRREVQADVQTETPYLELHIVKLPAIRANAAEDPLFVLAGGPGQGASEVIATLYPSLRKIHQKRTLIFLDQRGTGKSNPLDCELPDDMGLEIPTEALQLCREGLVYDPKWFQTSYLAADTEHVRQALGYEQINLYGVSYGTRLGLTILRDYPQSVRSAVLDGVIPFQKSIGEDFGSAVRRSLDSVFRNCEEDSACHERFPTIREEYERVVQSFQEEAVRSISHPHPRTGQRMETEVSVQMLWSVLQQMLYQDITRALIPHVIHQIATEEDWSMMVGWLHNNPFEGIPIGLYLSIVCAEDVPRIDFTSAPEMDLGVLSTTQMQEMCSVWKVNPVQETFYTPLQSNTPILLLSGEYDPVTPPEYGDLALSTLQNAKHVVVSGMGHNTITQHCVSEMLRDFMMEPNPSLLEDRCPSTLKGHPFILSTTGTAP